MSEVQVRSSGSTGGQKGQRWQ